MFHIRAPSQLTRPACLHYNGHVLPHALSIKSLSCVEYTRHFFIFYSKMVPRHDRFNMVEVQQRMRSEGGSSY